MSAVVVGPRPPYCAAQPGCERRSVGIVKTAARAANACAEHGPAAAARLGARWTPVQRWQEEGA